MSMSVAEQPPILRRALTANWIFSATGGVLLLVLAVPLSEVLGVPAAVLAIVGIGLVPFAALVRTVGRSHPIDLRAASAVVVADALWVAGSIAVAALGGLLTTTGIVIVLLVAAVVAGFGVAQAIGIRSIARA